MMVHHFRICKHHLSLWYYRRGARIYSVYTGLAKTNLIKQLEAAGAARGLPGDHGFSPHKQFFQYQRYALQPVVKASGHEPRSASGGQRTHQNLRSELMRARRISSYQDSRRKSRREYRQWRSDIRSTVNFTLAQYWPPRKGCKLVFNSKFDPLVLVKSPLAALPTPSFSVNSSNAIGSPFHLPAFRLWLRRIDELFYIRGT